MVRFLMTQGNSGIKWMYFDNLDVFLPVDNKKVDVIMPVLDVNIPFHFAVKYTSNQTFLSNI